MSSNSGYTGKVDLLKTIPEIYIILNGQIRKGKEAVYASDFKTTRYAIILLSAITLEIFKSNTIEINNSLYHNFYQLGKVADTLRLKYDRTKQAKKIYDELTTKGEVIKEVTEDNSTFITLSKKGKRRCLEKIEELKQLKTYLEKIPSLESRYTQEAQYKESHLTKKSGELQHIEKATDKLIKSISNWD